MKLKRSHRLVDLTYYLLQHPHQLISLSYFSERYESAKSSISEDISIIKEQFSTSGIGEITTTAGAAGGVTFIPKMASDEAHAFVEELCQQLNDDRRMLPGGYFYMSDLLGDPQYLRRIGQLVASVYADARATVIMTVATKGIALAEIVAQYLNVPFVTAQRDTKLAEGSSVSVNYVSGSDRQVDKMALTKDSLGDNENILIVDDFMNAGGTMNGMLSMVKEFNSHCVGAVVLAEVEVERPLVEYPYRSIIKIKKTEDDRKIEHIQPGNLLEDYHD